MAETIGKLLIFKTRDYVLNVVVKRQFRIWGGPGCAQILMALARHALISELLEPSRQTL